MRFHIAIAGAVAAAAVALTASPAAAASADLSLERAEREAIKAVAPLQVEGAFCLRTSPLVRKKPKDRAVCIVTTTAPPGQQCTSIIYVKKQRGLRGAAAIKVQKVSINRCFPKPSPLGSPESR